MTFGTGCLEVASIPPSRRKRVSELLCDGLGGGDGPARGPTFCPGRKLKKAGWISCWRTGEKRRKQRAASVLLKVLKLSSASRKLIASMALESSLGRLEAMMALLMSARDVVYNGILPGRQFSGRRVTRRTRLARPFSVPSPPRRP